MTEEIKYKTCTKCHRTLEANLDNFGREKRGLYGITAKCKVCMKAWRDDYKEKKKEYDKKYNQDNKEQRKEYYTNRYYEKREEMLEYFRKRSKLPEVIQKKREYRKSRKDRDKELSDKWRNENKERIAEIKKNRYEKEKSLPDTLTEEEWMDCLNYFDNKCAYCGEEKYLTKEHVVPIYKDGGMTKDNIVPSCINCNSSKQQKDLLEWYPIYEFYNQERLDKIQDYLNIHLQN